MAWKFAKWVADHRKLLRLSGEALAGRVDVTKSYISKIENATAPLDISRAILDGLADAFGVDRAECYKLYLDISDQPEEDKVLLFHLPKGSRIPIPITDQEIIAATEKLVRAKIKTE